jgi:fumarate reductase subunit D
VTTVVAAPRRSWIRPAAVAAAAALVLTLIGTYLDTPFRSSGPQTWGIATGGRSIVELVLLVLFALAGAALVFGLIVRLALREQPARTAVVAMVTAIIGVLTIIVFWTGLPAIFAIAAVLLASNARRRLGYSPVAATVAFVLALVTIAGAIGIAFTG